MKKKDIEEKSHLKKKKHSYWVASGFTRVMDRPAGSIGFFRVIALADFLLYPDRSRYQVNLLD